MNENPYIVLKALHLTADDIIEDRGMAARLRTAGKADEADALEVLQREVGSDARKANQAEQDISRAAVASGWAGGTWASGVRK